MLTLIQRVLHHKPLTPTEQAIEHVILAACITGLATAGPLLFHASWHDVVVTALSTTVMALIAAAQKWVASNNVEPVPPEPVQSPPSST